MFGRVRHGRKEKLRAAREVSTAANGLLAQKENLDAMSWEGVRDIAGELLQAVDRGDRESAHQLACSLQSIANDNIRVLYRFNIPDADMENSRLLRSGMRVLPPEPAPADAGSGSPARSDTQVLSPDPALAVEKDAGDPGVLLGVESVDEHPADRPFYRRDVYPAQRRVIEDALIDEDIDEEPDEGSGERHDDAGDAWQALADEAAHGEHSEAAQVLMAQASARAREEAAKRLPKMDDTPVRESEDFREFLRTLDRRHPSIEG